MQIPRRLKKEHKTLEINCGTDCHNVFWQARGAEQMIEQGLCHLQCCVKPLEVNQMAGLVKLIHCHQNAGVVV